MVFGVILGTGVGGGIVVDGKVIAGANAIAGEWGHNPMPEAGRGSGPPERCGCGRTGCIERLAERRARSGATTCRGGGREISAAEVARLAAAGDDRAAAAIRRFEQRLAVAMAGIVNILDPDVIVLGGGLASIASLYARVPELWRALCVAPEPATRLVPARFGPESGLRGAAWLGASGGEKA